MPEKIKIIFLIIFLAVIIFIITFLRYTYPIFLGVYYTFGTLIPIIIPSSIAAYFSKKFLKNFEKNEKYVAALIFVHPKIRESFKFMFISAFIFGISWCISMIKGFAVWLAIVSAFAIIFSTYLVLLSFIYFFKTLYDITKSE